MRNKNAPAAIRRVTGPPFGETASSTVTETGAAHQLGDKTMDPVNLTYYAVVCGGLAAYSPTLANRIVRLVMGFGVGALSAFLLPTVHRLLGF